jgi:hypothetical protein
MYHQANGPSFKSCGVKLRSFVTSTPAQEIKSFTPYCRSKIFPGGGGCPLHQLHCALCEAKRWIFSRGKCLVLRYEYSSEQWYQSHAINILLVDDSFECGVASLAWTISTLGVGKYGCYPRAAVGNPLEEGVHKIGSNGPGAPANPITRHPKPKRHLHRWSLCQVKASNRILMAVDLCG